MLRDPREYSVRQQMKATQVGMLKASDLTGPQSDDSRIGGATDSGTGLWRPYSRLGIDKLPFVLSGRT